MVEDIAFYPQPEQSRTRHEYSYTPYDHGVSDRFRNEAYTRPGEPVITTNYDLQMTTDSALAATAGYSLLRYFGHGSLSHTAVFGAYAACSISDISSFSDAKTERGTAKFGTALFLDGTVAVASMLAAAKCGPGKLMPALAVSSALARTALSFVRDW